MWWKNNQQKFPILSILAKQYLGIPSKSAASERMFSKAGNLISKNERH
jgi:hypothetical protein